MEAIAIFLIWKLNFAPFSKKWYGQIMLLYYVDVLVYNNKSYYIMYNYDIFIKMWGKNKESRILRFLKLHNLYLT